MKAISTAGYLGPDEARLDVLVNVAGFDQLTASRILWGPRTEDGQGPAPVPPRPLLDPTAAHAAWARAWARHLVRTRFADVFAWLAGANA